MIVPDVNMLLYAEIDAYREHRKARLWWESLLGGDDQVGIAPPALFGFVRIATNPRVFSPALDIDSALARVEDWLLRPNVRVMASGPRHLEIAFRLLRALGSAGNLTTETQLATYAIENSATLCSNDSDFAQFAGLAWRNPLK